MKSLLYASLLAYLVVGSNGAPTDSADAESVKYQLSGLNQILGKRLDELGLDDIKMLMRKVKAANDNHEPELLESFPRKAIDKGIGKFIAVYRGKPFEDNEQDLKYFKSTFEHFLKRRCEVVKSIFLESPLHDVIKDESLLRSLDRESLDQLKDIKLCITIMESPDDYCLAGFKELVA